MLDQPARIAALRTTGLLSPKPSVVLDGLARTATRLLKVPVALVSLVDDTGQWFPGLAGLTGWAAEARHTPLSHSFCQHVVTTRAPLAVEDATVHPLVRDSPAIEDLGVCAYLGVPLVSAEGHVLGALCAIDHAPRHWTAQDEDALLDVAAAVSAELRRCEREQRFELAVEATQEVLYTHDYAGGFVERHGAVEAIYGRTAAQLANTSDEWLGCVAPEDRERVAASWEAALTRGSGRWHCEYRMLHPDGTIVFVDDRARIITDAAGTPVQVAGAVRDVTAERMAQTALQAAEAKWRRLLEVAYEGICTVDAAGLITYANPRFAEMLQRTRDELLGLDFFGLLNASDAAAARARFAANRWGTSETHEVMLHRRDATPLWALQAASPVFEGDGTFVETLYLHSDVTARHIADAERDVATSRLRATEARLRLAMSVAGMVVWERDLDSDVLWNLVPAEGTEMRADVMGQFADFLDAVHPEDRARVAQANAAAIAADGDFAVEHRIAGVDGSLRWLRSVGGVVGGDANGPRRVVGVSLDVTEQRTLEDQLRQAQKLEAVGQLAGGIAHDFNNLLTVISGSLELLTDDLPSELPDDHPARTDAAEIRHAAERAGTLVRQLLTFSRKQPISATLLDLGSVVRNAERLLRRVIGEEISLDVEIGAERGTIEADAGQLEQVLMNLAVNARDALLTPQHGYPGHGGTLRLAVDTTTLHTAELGTWPGLSEGRYARLTVTDTGHGMDAATRLRVFEPFFTTKDVGLGTGLGLSTVFGIVQQAHGAIHVDSTPGVGTTFTILFPLVTTAQVNSNASPTAPLPVSGATVLLVEDEPALRLTTRRLLERGGYTVREAANGSDALRSWTAHGNTIDVILTDVRMPEVGGHQLMQRLRAERPTLPVVYMSGYSETRIATMDAGANEAFVAKPFSSVELLQTLADVLGTTAAGG